MDLTRILIFLATTLCAGSWVLSFFHRLNARGYFVLFALQAVVIFLWVKAEGFDRDGARRTLRKLARRFRRLLPASFLALSVVNFLGGALNDVTNGDSIAYRIPRVLHWFAENGWHWIHAGDERMNVVGLNYELLSAPIMLFSKSDRWIFLLCFLGYLWLPGLFFSFLRLVGVRGKVAWWWMWLLPAGYIYAMQASSVSTDGFSATVALAAVVFALRGVGMRRVGDLWISILAFGFLTGIKQVTLPLAIIWIIPVLVGWKLLLRKPLIAGVCVGIAILASALPITLANIHYTGSWKGFKRNYEQASPIWGLIGNTIIIPIQNLQPPLFPWADQWNEGTKRFRATPLGKKFYYFEEFATLWRAPNEINAGLGFGHSILILASLAAMSRIRGGKALPVPLYIRLVRWSPLIAAAAFMGKSALMQPARYFAPFYPFLLPLLLTLPANSALIRKRWWRGLACGVAALTLALLLTSRQRPIFPADATTAWLKERFPNNGFIAKVRNSFSFYFQDKALLADIQRLIPSTETRVGYAAIEGKKERALWRSTEGRRVYWILVTDDWDYARSLGVNYVLVEPSAIEKMPGKSIQSWLERYPGEIVGEIGLRPLPEAPPEIAFVVKLKR